MGVRRCARLLALDPGVAIDARDRGRARCAAQQPASRACDRSARAGDLACRAPQGAGARAGAGAFPSHGCGGHAGRRRLDARAESRRAGGSARRRSGLARAPGVHCPPAGFREGAARRLVPRGGNATSARRQHPQAHPARGRSRPSRSAESRCRARIRSLRHRHATAGADHHGAVHADRGPPAVSVGSGRVGCGSRHFQDDACEPDRRNQRARGQPACGNARAARHGVRHRP